MHILALDRAGNPSTWLDLEPAILLIALGRMLAPLGDAVRIVHGGVNARTGLRSCILVPSILLTQARVEPDRWRAAYAPPLTNKALFARDGHLCLYCGGAFPGQWLTRDHVIPRSRGGTDAWSNVVTSCRNCNQRKGSRTPTEWGVELKAVPYTPCHAEHLMLANRQVLADQMTFLQARMRPNPRGGMNHAH